jgi:hypothetical protein
LYLLTATPTPIQDIRFPADLYKVGSEGDLALVREVAPASDGVNSVEFSAEQRIISVATPLSGPHTFSHCCPRQDRVVPRFGESKGVERAKTQVSD